MSKFISEPTPALAHLYALRAQLDAIILGCEHAARETNGALTCPHPEELQKDATTAGGPRRVFCLACNTERDA